MSRRPAQLPVERTRPWWRRVVPLGLGLPLALALSGCGPEAPKGTRVVLVTLDTLRHDRFAGPDGAMPRLAAAARDGLVFERFYAATSSTQPTHATIFTGLHPWQHGVVRNGMVLSDDVTTVAEHLAAAGFHGSAAVAAFPVHGKFGFRQGFDTYVDDFTEKRSKKKTWEEFGADWSRFYSQADTVTASALQLIDTAEGDRQFFWFHFFDPHSPYGDSAQSEDVVHHRSGVLETRDLTLTAQRNPEQVPTAVTKALQLYDADIAYMDAQIGRLLDRLAEDDDRFVTHVIVTADHGESFGDDGSFGHGDRVTSAQLRVPLVILSPDVRAGVRDDVAGSSDLAATILALAGVAPPDGPPGRALTEADAPPAGPTVGMRRTYAEPVNEMRADGSAVLISGSRFYLARDEALYFGDAAEVRARDGQPDPDVLEQTRHLFAAFQAELDERDADELLDEQTQAALEALGYVR